MSSVELAQRVDNPAEVPDYGSGEPVDAGDHQENNGYAEGTGIDETPPADALEGASDLSATPKEEPAEATDDRDSVKPFEDGEFYSAPVGRVSGEELNRQVAEAGPGNQVDFSAKASTEEEPEIEPYSDDVDEDLDELQEGPDWEALDGGEELVEDPELDELQEGDWKELDADPDLDELQRGDESGLDDDAAWTELEAPDGYPDEDRDTRLNPEVEDNPQDQVDTKEEKGKTEDEEEKGLDTHEKVRQIISEGLGRAVTNGELKESVRDDQTVEYKQGNTVAMCGTTEQAREYLHQMETGTLGFWDNLFFSTMSRENQALEIARYKHLVGEGPPPSDGSMMTY